MDYIDFDGLTASRQFLSLTGQGIRLGEDHQALAARFAQAQPFPHLVLDGLFPDALLDDLLAELPALTDANMMLYDDGNLLKFNTRSPVDFGEVASRFTALLHSAIVLHLVSALTGIEGLLPDPYMHGGGFHAVPRGGKFDIHVDSNVIAGLQRRLALIVFLNRDWKPEYNGQLELWDSTATRCVTEVAPLFNRTILFLTGEHTYHGYSKPLNAPRGMLRKSFLNYYYQPVIADDASLSVHSTLYAPQFKRNKLTMRRVIEEVVPPVLVRSVRRLKASLG